MNPGYQTSGVLYQFNSWGTGCLSATMLDYFHLVGLWWSIKVTILAVPEGNGGYSPGTILKCLMNQIKIVANQPALLRFTGYSFPLSSYSDRFPNP